MRAAPSVMESRIRREVWAGGEPRLGTGCGKARIRSGHRTAGDQRSGAGVPGRKSTAAEAQLGAKCRTTADARMSAQAATEARMSTESGATQAGVSADSRTAADVRNPTSATDALQLGSRWSRKGGRPEHQSGDAAAGSNLHDVTPQSAM
jgi:hypothetical protein